MRKVEITVIHLTKFWVFQSAGDMWGPRSGGRGLVRRGGDLLPDFPWSSLRMCTAWELSLCWVNKLGKHVGSGRRRGRASTGSQWGSGRLRLSSPDCKPAYGTRKRCHQRQGVRKTSPGTTEKSGTQTGKFPGTTQRGYLGQRRDCRKEEPGGHSWIDGDSVTTAAHSLLPPLWSFSSGSCLWLLINFMYLSTLFYLLFMTKSISSCIGGSPSYFLFLSVCIYYLVLFFLISVVSTTLWGGAGIIHPWYVKTEL